MPEYTLDPTKLYNDNELIENRDKLRNILIHIIKTARSPFISGGQFGLKYNNKEISILLTHNLLIRPREHHKGQTRVEILNRDALAEGGYAQIYESQGVLKPEDNYKFKSKPVEKSRICKVIPIKKTYGQAPINCEAMYTAMNPLLHSKSAVFSDLDGYIIMRHAQKDDLFELVAKLEAKTITLTIEQRFQITYKMMKAFKKQALNLEILHNDLKPENLIIDWEKNKVTLIDYYFAQPFIIDNKAKINTTLYTVFGTPGYIAPEIFLTGKRTLQTELFALGLTIAFFFGDTSITNCRTEDLVINPQLFYQNRNWKNLFRGIELPDDIKQKVTGFLDIMTDINPKNRFQLIDDAMAHWTSIHSDYKILQKKREEHLDESLSTLKKALEGFSIFKYKPTSQHNSPQLAHKARIDDHLKAINYNVGM